MSEAVREEIYDVTAEQFYAAITDYEQYAAMLPEVDNVEVLENSETGAKIRYSINVIKKFSYILRMHHQRPSKLAWAFDSGSLFKENSGSWQIEDLGDERCKVTYTLKVSLKVFAPKSITQKLLAVNLPRMMKAFYELAKTK